MSTNQRITDHLSSKPLEYGETHDLMSLDPKVVAVQECGLRSLMSGLKGEEEKKPKKKHPVTSNQLISIDTESKHYTDEKKNQIKETMKKWESEINNLKMLIGKLPNAQEATDTDLLNESAAHIEDINKSIDSLEKEKGCIAIYSKDGMIEAIGIYSKKENTYILDHLLTAPKNLQLKKLPNSIKSVRGAGSLVVQHLTCMALRDQILNIELESFETEKFYEGLGFKKKEGTLFTFSLQMQELHSKTPSLEGER